MSQSPEGALPGFDAKGQGPFFSLILVFQSPAGAASGFDRLDRVLGWAPDHVSIPRRVGAWFRDPHDLADPGGDDVSIPRRGGAWFRRRQLTIAERAGIGMSQSPEGAAPGFDGAMFSRPQTFGVSQSPEGAAPGFDKTPG